jgi:GGDEF domain-containing protein
VTIDLFTASLMTAIVCNVAGAAFIVETLLRRDEGVGRMWSLAFLCGMATTVAYMMWAAGSGGYLAVAVGNGLFVSTTGCLWLGSRRFNERPLAAAGLLVVAVGIIVAAAAAFEGPDGGDWAGWLPMGIALVVFGALAAAETFRSPMGRIHTSWALAGVFCVEAVFYAARVLVFVVAGPDSEIFNAYFSTNVTSMLTVALTIVAVVVTSVLRASRSDLRANAWMTRTGVASDGIVMAPTFQSALRDVTERSSWRGELVGVIAVRIEDLQQISTAFGADVANEVEVAWRAGVRRYAPANSFVGEDGRAGLLVAIVSTTAADARRQAAAIYRGLFDRLGAITGAVIPVVGVGVALSESAGYDPDLLVRQARDAARRAAINPDSSVVFGGTPDIVRPRQD